MQITHEMLAEFCQWLVALPPLIKYGLAPVLFIFSIFMIRRHCEIEWTGEAKYGFLKLTLKGRKANATAELELVYRIGGCGFNRMIRIIPTDATIYLVIANHTDHEIVAPRVELRQGDGFDPLKIIREQSHHLERYFTAPDGRGGQMQIFEGSAETRIYPSADHPFAGLVIPFKLTTPFWITVPYRITSGSLNCAGTLRINYFDLLGTCRERLKNETAYIPPDQQIHK